MTNKTNWKIKDLDPSVNESSVNRPCTVLLSVGGSPGPLLHVLRQKRPANVWYFCSAGSRAIADDIHRLLDWHPDRDFIEVERFEEIGPCYRRLRAAIPDFLKRWKVRPEDVVVDYTGGTKTMSAALVLAATEFFEQFTYVGAEQRGKGGLGVTIDGKERMLYQQNPWSELAIREVARACDAWSASHYDLTAEIFRKVAGRVTIQQGWFEMLGDLADGMAARHRLDFSSAAKRFGIVRGKVRPFCEGRLSEPLIRFVEKAQEIGLECGQNTASGVLLRELLDNALRTAGQGRFEDASARLYRAMEMQGQLWLSEKTDGAFRNGRLERGASVPGALLNLEFCQKNHADEIKLSLEQIFLALACLEDPRASRVVTDIRTGRQSRWRQATEKRNSSILGHGVAAIGERGFEQMREIAADFLGFNLSAPANPIPALNPDWFSER